jgi:Putative phage tail protein
MGKVLKIVAGITLAVFAFPIAAAILPAATAVTTAAAFASTIMAVGASLALSGVAQFLVKTPQSQLSRLNATLDVTTPRKAVFGTTAMNLDIRYQEASGTNQEYIDYVICVAAHKVKAISEIWFEEKQAWTSGGGVTSTYSGYLTVNTILEGSAASYFTVNGGARWGASTRLTGCGQIHLRIKRTGNDKKSESPLVSGLPSRITVIGEGALLYDPRRDSTVAGGSGTHRADDQATWGTYTDPDDTDNPAMQLLWWLLGWRINDKLSIGCGVPPERIDLASFITAANICDESVTLATGGTQKRYRTSGTASDADDRMSIINTFMSCMNGTLRDNGGKLTLQVMKNDLADYVLDFDEDDILGEFEWNQTRGLTDSYNAARGRFVDPSNNSLYQMADYPEVGFISPDGIQRVMALDLPFVEDGRRAQRIAKQVLQRNQYRGMFSATFKAKALGCSVGNVVRLTFPALGWSNKLFRVVSQEIRFDGLVPLALVEENAAIYAWSAEDVAPVSPTAPVVYNPLNNPFMQGIAQVGSRHEPGDTTAAFTANFAGVLDAGQLPRNIAFKRWQINTDVTTSATWSITTQGTITGGTVTVSSSGVVTIPSGVSIPASTEIVVSSVHDGVTLISRIAVTKTNGASPPGTGGGTTVTDSTFNTVSTTTLAAISNILTVKTGTSGQLTFSAPLSIYAAAASPDGTFGAIGQWRYRPISGSFTDAGTQADETSMAEVELESGIYFAAPGYIEVSATVTGLTASTDYEVQLFAARDSASPTKTLSFGGTATVTGS